MKPVRIICILLCVSLCASLFLAGCQSPPADAPAQDAPAQETPATEEAGEVQADQEPVTISILTRAFNDNSNIFSLVTLEYLNEWMAMNPHVTVINDSIFDEDQFNNRFSIAVANDEMPTLFMSYGGQAFRTFIDAGLVLDLEQSGLMDRYDDFFGMLMPVAFSSQRFTDMPGSTFGFAMDMFATGIYYNRSMFEEHGIAVPTTMEELEDAFEAFMALDIIPMALGNGSPFMGGHLHAEIMMKMFGSDMMYRLADREVNWTDNEVIESLRIIYDWNNRGFFGPDTPTLNMQGARTLFKTGQTPMHHHLLHNYVVIVDDSEFTHEDAGLMPFPYFSDRPEHRNAFHSGTNMNFSFSADATEAELEAVMSLVKHIFGRQAMQQMVDVSGGAVIPTRIDVEIPDFVQPGVREFLEAFAMGTDFAKEAGEYDSNPAIRNVLRDSIQGMTAGVSPEDTAQIIQDAINRGG